VILANASRRTITVIFLHNTHWTQFFFLVFSSPRRVSECVSVASHLGFVAKIVQTHPVDDVRRLVFTQWPCHKFLRLFLLIIDQLLIIVARLHVARCRSEFQPTIILRAMLVMVKIVLTWEVRWSCGYVGWNSAVIQAARGDFSQLAHIVPAVQLFDHLSLVIDFHPPQPQVWLGFQKM
jgi:hypothetical protein